METNHKRFCGHDISLVLEQIFYQTVTFVGRHGICISTPGWRVWNLVTLCCSVRKENVQQYFSAVADHIFHHYRNAAVCVRADEARYW